MKQCPQCKTTYTDDTLSFCLADGTPLASKTRPTEAETVLSFNPGKPVVIDVAQDTPPTFAVPPSYNAPAQPPQKSGLNPMLVIGIVGVLIFVIATLGAVLLIQNLTGKENANNVVTTTPTPAPSKSPSPSATPTPAKTPAATPANVNTGPTLSGNSTTVTAYSPGDGYLVLRSQPNTTSTEMARIPHGNELTIVSCKGYTTTKLGNYGRWCTASYNGISGWVFDAFVKY